MRAIKIICILFFLIILSVVPLCIYLDHLKWLEIKSVYPPDALPKNEGLQFFIPFGFAAYSSIFMVWLAFIFFRTTSENFKRRIGELVGVFILSVVPAVLIIWLFYAMLK